MTRPHDTPIGPTPLRAVGIRYREVALALSTHGTGGPTRGDLDLAGEIDAAEAAGS